MCQLQVLFDHNHINVYMCVFLIELEVEKIIGLMDEVVDCSVYGVEVTEGGEGKGYFFS